MLLKKFGKRTAMVMACVLAITAMTACGKKDSDSADSGLGASFEPITNNTDSAAESTTAEEVTEEETYEVPEGMYLSEITGEPISEELKDQRPIAVMVDNEKIALPHYQTADADVVYEIMNSTKNDRVTRFMCIFKDWGSIEQLGSVRSTRPTNILLAAEWNAVLCHDGGPYHNDAYFANPWAEHFSGTFSRVNNGKKREFTEYVVKGDLEKNFKNSGFSTTYNEYANEGSHFNFVPYGKEVKLDEKYSRSYPANSVSLPFKHTGTQLKYNEETKEYEQYEYDARHEDAETGAPLSFKNVILQNCSFNQLDDNGYLIYNCVGSGNGWYLTNGLAKDISWVKDGLTGVTKFYDENGDELQINTGKTYISLIPEDSWSNVAFE